MIPGRDLKFIQSYKPILTSHCHLKLGNTNFETFSLFCIRWTFNTLLPTILKNNINSWKSWGVIGKHLLSSWANRALTLNRAIWELSTLRNLRPEYLHDWPVDISIVSYIATQWSHLGCLRPIPIFKVIHKLVFSVVPLICLFLASCTI